MVSAVTPNYRGEPEQEVLLHLTRLFPPRKEAGHARLGTSSFGVIL